MIENQLISLPILLLGSCNVEHKMDNITCKKKNNEDFVKFDIHDMTESHQ